MIAIVKYNAGNLRSVENALKRLGATYEITDSADRLHAADHVIFPGVGEASSAMSYLRSRGLDQVIRDLRRPFLGICLGLQLMCAHSEEGNTECLGIFEEQVKRFPDTGKVPHMGWNNFKKVKGPLFNGILLEDDVYYVHSYYAEVGDETSAICEYLVPFSAAIQKNNFYGVQFHPEKSAEVGEKLIENFLKL
ncbi:MAG: imidazole glycerol phosphate synthase subunit HisH [Bacteroidia bacterium]